MLSVKRRGKGQAIVEFGIIALLFTALMFAVVDLGLLLNTWLTVSSASKDLARSAAVGKKADFLLNEAQSVIVPSVTSNGFAAMCCGATDALEVKVDYFPGGATPCPPWQSGCNPIGQSSIDIRYPYGELDTLGNCPPGPTCHPQSDDIVRITVIAHGAQIITPLLRPFFGCTNGSNPNCYVPLTTTTMMRYEGQEF